MRGPVPCLSPHDQPHTPTLLVTVMTTMHLSNLYIELSLLKHIFPEKKEHVNTIKQGLAPLVGADTTFFFCDGSTWGRKLCCVWRAMLPC